MDKPPPPRPALIVHAGAWAIPEEERPAHRAGCLAAVRAGWARLQECARAIEVVRAAVRVLEEDPALNAGTGCVLDRDGNARLDAGLMFGSDRSVGAVAGVARVKHPIEAAEVVRESRHVLLAGEGAEAFVASRGMTLGDADRHVVPREVARLEAWRARRPGDGEEHGTDFGSGGSAVSEPPSPGDTVGAVAVDSHGRIAAAASTGGLCGKRPGRVGDTPVPGAGFYADDILGGAACTGHGEALLSMGLARRACELARENSAPDATWLAMQELEKRWSGKGGVILIARNGSIGFSFNTPAMAVAYMDAELIEPFVGGM